MPSHPTHAILEPMNEYLYAWEGFACIMVMTIHCLLPGELNTLAPAMARFGVPLFFAVSGKYLAVQTKATQNYSKDPIPALRKILIRRICRTSRIIVVVVSIYTVYSLVWHLARGESFI